ncbi:ABC transporter substrate-binding protein [Granulosicoccus antarcticus]|uniref:Thiamine biosynthesis protein n=1 Tax=Granulosicoccus antarcticus IMCC3135 TaxID=1192854 RepID=A0A2Z2P2V2_9GAMM|nr:ABC transporter substrate-binding protein [Granulosicoccus antarcticus]ASJ74054.1 Putative thiamine biosynthesis protein [Granulosicoccus antarcticus IMCC3135]
MKRLNLLLALWLFSTASLADDKPLTVLLDWFVNPDHAQLILAKELGYFKEEGLDVELIEPADPSLPPKMVAAGKADVAISYQPQLHVQVAEGLPLSRFGTLISTPLNSLVVLADGPVKSIADLKGRKVGFSVGGFEDALLKAMLDTESLSLDDIELVNVNFSLSPALITGQVDAVIGAYRNFELNQLDIEGFAGKAYYPEEHGVPLYDELILVTNNESRDAEWIVPFLRAVERATTYLANHSDDAWELFKNTNTDILDNELNQRAWRDTLHRFALRPAALDTRRYEDFARFLQKQGLIDTLPETSTYAYEAR